MTGTRRHSIAIIGIVALFYGESAQAQPYPERPVSIVVPCGAGGLFDTVARILASSLASQLKQEVVIVNRPGAGGLIGTDAVAKAAPDGYTLLFGSSTALTVAPVLYSKIAYDPQTSFKPIAPVSLTPGVLVVNPKQAHSCPEFVQQARDNRGKYHYSSTGQGSQSYLDGEVFKMRAQIDIGHVPFRDVGESLSSIIAGKIEMTFQSLSAGLPLVSTQALRPLAITSEARNPKLPNVPTMKECGYPGFLSNWAALLAPANTPETIVAKLNETVNAGLRSAEVTKRLTDLGVEPLGGPPSMLAERIAVETKEWAAIARTVSLKVD